MQKKSGGSSRSIRSATTTIAAGSRFGMTDDDEPIVARTRAEYHFELNSECRIRHFTYVFPEPG